MIGRDTFTRYEQRDGPRKPNASIPETPITIDKTIKTSDPEVKNKSCSLNGVWYNHLGSEMILTQKDDNTIEGEYRTAVERETGAAGTSHSKVFGIGQLGGPNSTFSFFAKKVVSDSWVLVDFAIRLVNFVLNLPNGQVNFFCKKEIW